MPRLLQVVTDTDRRGAQVFATDLHGALARRGWAVRTVALARGAVGGLDLPVLGPTRTHPATLRALRRAARGADVVAAHGSTTLPACAIALAAGGPPFVYRQISDSRFWAPTRARRLRVRLGLRAASRVVALWSGSADTLERDFGVDRAKLSVIPNGVPPERFPPVDRAGTPTTRARLGLDPDRPVVAAIGALVPEKGVDLAVEAVAALDGVQLLVAGDGPERGALEALAAQRAPGRVVFTGSLGDPRPAFTAADVVVLASRGGDSMPAVLIEAGFMGVPVVSTPVEGIVDIVEPGRTGVLVAVDDPAALRDAIATVLGDPDTARSMAAAARRRCEERYAIDVVAASWDATLRAAASGLEPG
jgi:glycosyltransferase involved in cell wall biosynthesis